ncbi:MAG: hypothetical protein II180_04710, partial [Proteobacteria bacterium]|nr:hypothetical protein [Pseudomonadota bacterium]
RAHSRAGGGFPLAERMCEMRLRIAKNLTFGSTLRMKRGVFMRGIAVAAFMKCDRNAQKAALATNIRKILEEQWQ